jgi:hypothetical protein
MMPKRQESLISAALTEQTYRSDLEDLPVEELIKSFGDWRSGRHKRPDGSPFAPSIGEVRALVEKRISDRLMVAKRQRQLQDEAAESRAYRERIAIQTPEHRANVASVAGIIETVANSKGMANFKFSLGEASTNGWSDEQLADPNRIINEPGMLPYTMRPAINGMLREYGFLTRAEANSGRKNSPVDEFKNVGATAKASQTPDKTKEAAQSWLVENAGGHGQSPVRISAELAAMIEDQRR